MVAEFLHGVEVVQLDDGRRPIRTVKSSIIGLVGTASQGPENVPTLIAGSRREAVEIFGPPDGTHTIPDALDGILDQIGAFVIVVRVPVGADAAETKTNVIGQVDPVTDNYTGIQALLGAESSPTTKNLVPRILIAPGWTHDKAVVDELLAVADMLGAVVISDGPNTTDAEAVTYRTLYGSKRNYIVDPNCKVWDIASSAEVVEPVSARVAGLVAKVDNERGFWNSPSNHEIRGIIGTARPIEFGLGNPDTRANYLNENEVATIIHDDGFRLWGNRTCSTDPKWAFLNVVRTVDMVNISIQRAHRWAVDRNITRKLVEAIVDSVQAYLDELITLGALLGGRCWADPELNTPTVITAGKLYIDFDLQPPSPLEHLIFRSHLVDGYATTIFDGGAQ